MSIPVVDLFAGPGGLAEGFSSLRVDGRNPFKVVLSIEKDSRAHETLLLRGFLRLFNDEIPPDYWRHMRGELSRAELFSRFPHEYSRASQECVRHELGPESDLQTREMVRKALAGHSGAWGLIGGPPCQAYSLAGRSRNRGVEGYVPEDDHRQTLYVEYLQILADHRPAFFVMENVKGLISATLQSDRLFERIVADLQSPATALKREGRRSPRRGPIYRLIPLAQPTSGLFGPQAKDVIVRCEEYGIPQARHRVILLGIREDVAASQHHLMSRPPATVRATLAGLPAIRSGLTDLTDDGETWSGFISGLARRPWTRHVAHEVKAVIRDAADGIREFRHGRGAEFVRSRSSAARQSGGVANHHARAHIAADLERYFFASCVAKATGRSPTLSEFPTALLPNHANTEKAISGGHFEDRFRVQVWDRPSTTITSHISKDGHYYIHPDPVQCRSLTVREAARLQTFPDDYLFCGPRTSQYHQVGNAVPPALARQVARVVHQSL